MEELIYWKLKAQMTELILKENQLLNQLANVQTEKSELVKLHELDPNKNYKFNDKELRIDNV